MDFKMGQIRETAKYLSVICLGLIGVTSLSAQQPQLLATLEGHTDCVYSVAFSPDSKTLASGSGDHSIKLWDVATGNNTATLDGHTDEVFAVTFSPDGKTLASGSRDDTLWLWNAATGKVVTKFKKQDRPVRLSDSWCVESVDFSPDGKLLATSTHKSLTLWDVESGLEKTALGGLLGGRTVRFSPDGKMLAQVAGADGIPKLDLWDMPAGKRRFRWEGEQRSQLEDVAFSPDSKTLATACTDGRVILWYAASGKIKATFRMTGWAWAVAISPDGKTLAAGGGQKDSVGEIRLWNLTSEKIIATLEGHNDWISKLAFSPNGKILASASPDGTIILWEMPGMK